MGVVNTISHRDDDRENKKQENVRDANFIILLFKGIDIVR